MQPVIKHLPFNLIIVHPPESNQPAHRRVTAWLDQRDYDRRWQRIHNTLNVALAIIAATLIIVALGFYNH